MAILDELNTLQSNIGTAKQLLAANINSKGVSTVTSANTLTELANAVENIEQSGGTSSFVVPEGTRFGYSTWTEMPQEFVDYTKSLTVIPDYYLTNAHYVSNVELNENITYVGHSAFLNCSGMTTDVKLLALEEIKYQAFAYSGIKSLEITSPIAFTYSSDRQFERCKSLTSVTITSPITHLEGRMFSNCTSLSSITLPNTLEKIEEYCFEDCDSLTSFTIPDSVTTIESNIFYNCNNLTYVNVGNGINTISDFTFYNCDKMERVVLGKNVNMIKNYSFRCSVLNTIDARCLQVPTLSGSSVFGNLPTEGVVKHIPGLDYSGWIGTYSSGSNNLLPSGWTTEEYPSVTEVVSDSYIYQDGVFYEKIAIKCDFEGDGVYVESGIESIGNELVTSTTLISDDYLCDYINGNKHQKLEITVTLPNGENIGSGIYVLGDVLEEGCTECTITVVNYVINADKDNDTVNWTDRTYAYYDTEYPITDTMRVQINYWQYERQGKFIVGMKNYADNDSNDYRYFGQSNSLYYDTYNNKRIYNTLSGNLLNIEIGNYYIKNLDTDSIVTSSSTNYSFSTTDTLCVFPPDDYPIIDVMRLYSLKIYEGDTLMRDFIPCLDYNSNVCLLDKVENKLYYNQGPEDFLYG